MTFVACLFGGIVIVQLVVIHWQRGVLEDRYRMITELRDAMEVQMAQYRALEREKNDD